MGKVIEVKFNNGCLMCLAKSTNVSGEEATGVLLCYFLKDNIEFVMEYTYLTLCEEHKILIDESVVDF